MIELTLYNYLKTELNVPVFMEIPNNKNQYDKYVVLQKLDAGITNQIKSATFAVDSYAKSLYDAADLSDTVKETLFDAISLDAISSIKIGGEKANNNTQTKEYMYECTINVFHY